ncbi:MAG: hypothetical protein RJA19_1848 [Bacteroidota bacterium]|jgi:hypothetical protein
MKGNCVPSYLWVFMLGTAISCSTPTPEKGASVEQQQDSSRSPAPFCAVDPAIALMDTVALPLDQRKAAFRTLRAAVQAMEQKWEPPAPTAPPEEWVEARASRAQMEAAVWGGLSDSLGVNLEDLEGIWSEGISNGWE